MEGNYHEAQPLTNQPITKQLTISVHPLYEATIKTGALCDVGRSHCHLFKKTLMLEMSQVFLYTDLVTNLYYYHFLVYIFLLYILLRSSVE